MIKKQVDIDFHERGKNFKMHVLHQYKNNYISQLYLKGNKSNLLSTVSFYWIKANPINQAINMVRKAFIATNGKHGTFDIYLKNNKLIIE